MRNLEINCRINETFEVEYEIAGIVWIFSKLTEKEKERERERERAWERERKKERKRKQKRQGKRGLIL